MGIPPRNCCSASISGSPTTCTIAPNLATFLAFHSPSFSWLAGSGAVTFQYPTKPTTWPMIGRSELSSFGLPTPAAMRNNSAKPAMLSTTRQTIPQTIQFMPLASDSTQSGSRNCRKSPCSDRPMAVPHSGHCLFGSRVRRL